MIWIYERVGETVIKMLERNCQRAKTLVGIISLVYIDTSWRDSKSDPIIYHTSANLSDISMHVNVGC